MLISTDWKSICQMTNIYIFSNCGLFSSHSAAFIPWNRLNTIHILSRTLTRLHPPWVYAQLWGSGPRGAGSVSGRHGAARWSPRWCHPAGFPDQRRPPPLMGVHRGANRRNTNCSSLNTQPEFSTVFSGKGVVAPASRGFLIIKLLELLNTFYGYVKKKSHKA